MRIQINLASRPFVELRPLFARLRVAMAALAALAIGLGFGAHALAVQAKQASAQMDALKARTLAVQQATASDQARMRRPENQGVLERSQFLNALFAQKSFSWTGVMMDLEHVLPSGVQVTSIDPSISKEGVVSIRLRVTGDHERAIQLVRNLERSDRFLGPRLSSEMALTADKAKAYGGGSVQNVSADAITNGVEFEILSGYNPLPEKIVGSEKAPIADKTASSKSVSSARESAAGKAKTSVPAAGRAR